jgi:ubiquinone/menaquinone biosynthesis C-methylase UbiE
VTWEQDRAEIIAHYSPGAEEARLATLARLEHLRMNELLGRYLPPRPAVIADVGGGPGTYALPLARAGYRVHLLDPAPGHVATARRISLSQGTGRLASAQTGHARELPWPDESADACLLFGPMYHLTDSGERQEALAEARRILRPGGLLLVTAISRFASTMAGLARGLLADAAFEPVVDADVLTGQHRNPGQRPGWFTTAFYHRPDEFAAEVRDGGFALSTLLTVSGPAAYLQNLAWWLDDPGRRDTLLRAIRRVETEPSLLGAGPAVLAAARRA